MGRGEGGCKFTHELKSKYSCFRNGRDKWEAKCLVCKPGTYVSVANKGDLHLRAQAESSFSTKIWKPPLQLIVVLFMVDKWEMSSFSVTDIYMVTLP
jgi:hypothetical protein